jgi:hypothetical protein
MRGPNEIDFWRGFALLTIFIDHVPGLVFSNYTMRYFGLCDAAELFVFLAGWSLRLLMDGRKEPMSLPSAVMRLETRAMTIFFAQLIITQMALALTAAGRFDAYWERNLQPWDIAAGAFWAARTHLRDARPERYNDWMALAAEHPRAFRDRAKTSQSRSGKTRHLPTCRCLRCKPAAVNDQIWLRSSHRLPQRMR